MSGAPCRHELTGEGGAGRETSDLEDLCALSGVGLRFDGGRSGGAGEVAPAAAEKRSLGHLASEKTEDFARGTPPSMAARGALQPVGRSAYPPGR